MQHVPPSVLAGALIGAVCIIASLHYGTQFYPPGWEYELERRNNRRALVLLIVGIAAMAGPILMRI